MAHVSLSRYFNLINYLFIIKVRDLSKYYISLMAYLFYTYCDHNSSTLLPYIKVTYNGNLSLQQEAYWSGKKDQYKKIMNDNYFKFNNTLTLSSSSSDTSLNDKPFDNNNKNSIKIKRNHFISILKKIFLF